MVEIVSKGGNYLLNIGPMANGAIPGATVATLNKVGVWMQANSESIYGTSASPLPEQPWGRCTVKGTISTFMYSVGPVTASFVCRVWKARCAMPTRCLRRPANWR